MTIKKREKTTWMLADIKKEIYDPKEFNSFSKAIRVNMLGQMYDDEKFFSVIPLTKKQILKKKLKVEKLF